MCKLLYIELLRIESESNQEKIEPSLDRIELTKYRIELRSNRAQTESNSERITSCELFASPIMTVDPHIYFKKKCKVNEKTKKIKTKIFGIIK